MKLRALSFLAALSLAVLAPRAPAASLTILNTVTNGTSACTTTASTPCADNYGFATIPSGDQYYSSTINSVTANPTTYTLGNTLVQGGSPGTAADFGPAAYTNNSSCPPPTGSGSSPNCLDSPTLLTWNFQDNYEFLTPSSGPDVAGAVMSFDLSNGGVINGLKNIQVRIVQVGSNNGASDLIGTSAVSVVDGWQTVTSTAGSLTLYTATLNKSPLAANTAYYLQVRGETESSTAGYSGTVQFTPVPLPAGLPLLLSGLGLLGAVRRRWAA
jgi:hypothetical protein